MAKQSLTDEEVLARIELEEGQSYGINDAVLADSRAKALRYYNGEPFGNEIDGRSDFVSRDVLDVVESALPQLLKVFVSGDQVVKFEPKGPEDEQAAEQETDYINHVVMEKNNGFAVFYTWFKDALLSKNGYVKAYYEDETEVEKETYQGLTDGQLQMLIQDENTDVLEHTQYPDPTVQNALQGANPAQMMQMGGGVLPPPMLHDVKIQITNKKGCVKIENVAPEDLMVSSDCRSVSVQEARFVQHLAMMCRDEIEEQGWDLPEDVTPHESLHYNQEAISRDLYSEQQYESNPETDEYLVRDTYLRLDGEIKRFVLVGKHIAYTSDEDEEISPIATITPHVMPHRHVGMSYADLCEDIQDVKSLMIRGQIDNMYLSNNGRYAISDRVNLEDMLTSRPGGVVRVSGEPGAAILPLQHAPFPVTSFNMVEYFDSTKEKRTGITAYNQGMDADSLNKTATGVSQIMNAAQQRLELVARTFAETGVKELFTLVHRLVRKYQDKADVIRLRNQWVEVDPRQWKTRTDLSIAVGLGTGNKDQQLSHLGNLFQMQMATLQAGLPVVTPQNIYETVKQIASNAGFKQPEQFVTEPSKIPPAPPQEPPQVTVKKMELQADAQKFQAETETERQKAERDAQLEIQRYQADAVLKQQEQEKQMQQEVLRSHNDMVLEREKMAMQAELERYKAQLKAETDLKIATVEAELKAREMERQYHSDQQRMGFEMQKHQDTISAMNKPKTVKRDQNGRVAGIE